jgi:ketosteroid isomerase-like protein
MTDIDPNAFAREWVDAWNRRDLPAVLGRYADDVRFVSPMVYARRVNGSYEGAVEIFHFRKDGLVDSGEAMYGALASRGVPVA